MSGNSSGNEDSHGGMRVTPNERRNVMIEIAQSAGCLRNMEWTYDAALISKSVLTPFMIDVRNKCMERMASVTGRKNTALLYISQV